MGYSSSSKSHLSCFLSFWFTRHMSECVCAYTVCQCPDSTPSLCSLNFFTATLIVRALGNCACIVLNKALSYLESKILLLDIVIT